MKKLILSIASSAVILTAAGQTIRVQGNVTNLRLSDCSDCASSADPRINARLSTTSRPWSGEYRNEADNVGCSGNLTTNPGTYDVTGVGTGESWWVDIRGFEDDSFVCGGDDGDCNTYGGVSGISGTIITTWAPSCGGLYSTFSANRTCTSGGSQTYTCDTRLRYHWDAASITNASAGGTIAFVGPLTGCVNYDPGIITGNSLLSDRFSIRQWELSVNGGAFNAIGSATGQNYDPPALTTAGTYAYRRRLTYCTDFAGGTVSVYSNTITITINSGSVAPLSILGTNVLCLGSSTLLTLNGGNAGTGAIPQWFTGGCGTTPAGTGNSITVSPTSNTTYYVRYAGTCNTTSCASQLVSVTAPSAAGLSAGDYLWRGNTSSAWATSTNWYTWNGASFSIAGAAPNTTTADVIIEAGSSCVLFQPTVNTASVRNLTIRPGATLTHSGATILSVYGNFTNNGTFAPSPSGNVTFTGTGAGIISGNGALDFQNLLVSKTGSGSVTLGAPVRVQNTYFAQTGTLYAGANQLEVGTTAVAPGLISYSAGTVVGTIKKWIPAATGATIFLPVGNDVTGVTYNRYATLNYTTPPSGGSLTVRFVPGAAPLYAGLPLNDAGQQINNFADEGYWEMNPGDGLTGGTYTLGLRGNNFTNVSDLQALRIIKSPDPHVTWTLNGTHAGPNSGTLADPVVSRSGMSGFSWFTISGDDFNPLPVELVSFDASCVGKDIVLSWSTASEQNNQYFSIEHSEDAVAWSEIGRVNGAGNSNSLLNYSYTDGSKSTGINYYRLRQVDVDGQSETFAHRSISCMFMGNNSMFIFPNPADERVNIAFRLDQDYGDARINLLDQFGRIVRSVPVALPSGESTIMIDRLSELPSGAYHLSVQSESCTFPVQKLIVK